jgi:hypothetical protein
MKALSRRIRRGLAEAIFLPLTLGAVLALALVVADWIEPLA